MPAATSRLYREDHDRMIATLRAQPLRLLALVVLLAAVSLTAATPALRAAETGSDSANQALAWLRTQQLSNGGFAAFGGESDPGTTADAVFAFAAAGIQPQSVTSADGASAIDYLIANAQAASGDPGLSGKVALALMAAGANPRDVGGVDLISAIANGFDPEPGFYGMGVFNHAYALLALSAANAEIEPAAIDALLAAQIEDGSWGFTGDTTPGTGDSNTTAFAIQALVALEAGEDAIANGLNYIRSLQDENGAVAYDASGAPDLIGDANSTAVAIQAFIAAGEDPSQMLEALSAFQNPNGAFFWRPDFADDSLLATAQAVPALLEAPLPLPAVPATPDPVKPSLPDTALDEALQPAEPLVDCAYFDATAHNACGVFTEFWSANGGLPIFGYPLSEQFVDESGLTVQYFERARFEWHPDNAGTPYEVLLGRLGAEQTEHASSNP